jgi:hypothetical protein
MVAARRGKKVSDLVVRREHSAPAPEAEANA